jgi:hypothetical protein
VTALILSYGRMHGKAASALLAISQLQVGSMLFVSKLHGLEPGDQIQIGGETFRVTAAPPTAQHVLLEKMIRPELVIEPRPMPKFGSDRPYLKRKKGRS